MQKFKEFIKVDPPQFHDHLKLKNKADPIANAKKEE